MKTGAELITIERQEQIEKHGRTVELDVEQNKIHQLRIAAQKLVDVPSVRYEGKPDGWDETIWIKMCDKSYTERLIIAGALIAAEVDRMKYKK